MNCDEWRQLPEEQEWGKPERDEEYNHEDKIERLEREAEND